MLRGAIFLKQKAQIQEFALESDQETMQRNA
jgi:hypothetical protein